MAFKIISLAEVSRRTGLSRSTIWRLHKHKSFIPKIELSPGRVGYSEQMLEEWINRKFELLHNSTRNDFALPSGVSELSPRSRQYKR